MPTHAGTFRRMLIGSTTAKVLNDADSPVLTSRHAETIAPRPSEHRELLCTIGLDQDSERVLRYAHQVAEEAHSNLHIIHAIQVTDPKVAVQLDLEEQVQSEERQRARQRIADLQRRVGSQAPVRIVVGSIKEALLEATRQFDADALIIGRSPQSGVHGRLRDLTYAMVRDAPCLVLSALRKNLTGPAILAGLVFRGKRYPPPSWLGKCGNPASVAGFPSAVGTVEKSGLDFSTVPTARHFHSQALDSGHFG